MYGFQQRPNTDPTALGLAIQKGELYKPTTSLVTDAYTQEALQGVGTANADIYDYKVKEAEKTGAFVTEDEYKSAADLYSEGVPWHDGMTRESALLSKEFNDAVIERSRIMQDASTGQTILGFAAGFGAGIVEPKNAAVGVAVSATTAGLGSLGFLGNTARRLYQMQKNSLRARATIGLGEGVLAGAIVEPSNRSSAKTLSQDYTMADSLFNIATSAAFGGLLPVGVAGVKKLNPFIQSKIDKFKGQTMDVVAAEVDLATQQMALGQRVDVSAVEAAEIGSIAKKPVAEQAKAAEGFVRYTETPEFKTRFEGSKVSDADGRPLMVYHGTKADFNNFDADKKISRDGFWFGGAEEASEFALASRKSRGVDGVGANVRPSYLAIKDPFIHDPKEHAFMKIDEIVALAKNSGNDGMVFTNQKTGSKTYVAFSPEQIIPAFGGKSLSDIIAQSEATNASTIQKHNADAADITNDTLIDYSAMDAARAAESPDAIAEAQFKQDEAEIRQMLEQDILNEEDLKEYQSVLSELSSRAPVNALETLKLCLTRG